MNENYKILQKLCWLIDLPLKEDNLSMLIVLL